MPIHPTSPARMVARIFFLCLAFVMAARDSGATAQCALPAGNEGASGERGNDDGGPERDKHNDEIASPLVRQLLADDKSTREDAMSQIDSALVEMPKRSKSRMARDLLLVVASTRNHVRKPGSVQAAMTLLGRLKERNALMLLIPYITFPVQLPCLGFDAESNPCDSLTLPPSYLYPLPITNHGTGLTITESCPAVPALIQIGEPAIDPVARELAITRDRVRICCCLKVLKALENAHPAARAAIAKAIDKAWEQSDADRIRRYSKLLASEPDIELWSDKWEAND